MILSIGRSAPNVIAFELVFCDSQIYIFQICRVKSHTHLKSEAELHRFQRDFSSACYLAEALFTHLSRLQITHKMCKLL